MPIILLSFGLSGGGGGGGYDEVRVDADHGVGDEGVV